MWGKRVGKVLVIGSVMASFPKLDCSNLSFTHKAFLCVRVCVVPITMSAIERCKKCE